MAGRNNTLSRCLFPGRQHNADEGHLLERRGCAPEIATPDVSFVTIPINLSTTVHSYTQLTIFCREVHGGSTVSWKWTSSDSPWKSDSRSCRERDCEWAGVDWDDIYALAVQNHCGQPTLEFLKALHLNAPFMEFSSAVPHGCASDLVHRLECVLTRLW